jgi:hypothetical protein
MEKEEEKFNESLETRERVGVWWKKEKWTDFGKMAVNPSTQIL